MALVSKLVRAGAGVLLLSAVVLSGAMSVAAQPRALDVPYVPTPMPIVEAMLRLAKPTPSDLLIDLGCGDGRILIAAAKMFGARGIGIDINAVRIMEARANAQVAGVTDKVQFVEGDLFRIDFSQASVLTLYLLPIINMRLRAMVLAMKPGTRVVSHAFDFEDWEPDAVESDAFRKVFFWVVPAKVAGWWSGQVDGRQIEVELRQRFQRISGVSRVEDTRAPIEAGRLEGEAVTFAVTLPDGRRLVLAGRVDGTAMTGEGWTLKRQ